MNNITIAGNIGKDVEVRNMPNGDPVANFSIADSQGKEKLTIWWNCHIFGKRAESLAPYLTKGQQVTVTGTVTEREWKTKEGEKRKSLDVRVNDVLLQGSKPSESSSPRQSTPARQAAPVQRPQSTGFDDPNDDIPF